MFTQRRNALALAGVLAATAVTGGALVAVLVPHSAAPARLHAVTVVTTQPPIAIVPAPIVPAPIVPAPIAAPAPTQWHEAEGSDD